jgi:hypothetical protein
MQQAFDADVLVNIGPVHSLSSADEAKVCPLRGSGLRQAPGPSQWDTDNGSVGQIGDDLAFGDAHSEDAGIVIRQSVHTNRLG